jgi:hypothetical protein
MTKDPLHPSDSWLLKPLQGLLNYCRQNHWAGWDPYDGLSSPLFRLPFLQNHLCRLVFIQFYKRSPVNLRPLFRVPKEKNPKGVALFSSALVRLARLGLADETEAKQMMAELLSLRSPGWKPACWGYNFDWQTRSYLVPRFSPNIICTTFAANALLDGYDAYGNGDWLKEAVSAGDFLLNTLNRTGDEKSFCFSYTTLDRSRIHNANLIGAALLARLYAHTGSKESLAAARASSRFTIERIRPDGSWPYGEGSKQGWIDSFHTGYNLVALKRLRQYTGDESVDDVIKPALRYFREHFFEPNGVVKYYHNRTFPIDAHAIAQAIVTLLEFDGDAGGELPLAIEVCKWGLAHMRATDGSFYYQKRPRLTVKIPYMRWCQAWMLVAMASLAEQLREDSHAVGTAKNVLAPAL